MVEPNEPMYFGDADILIHNDNTQVCVFLSNAPTIIVIHQDDGVHNYIQSFPDKDMALFELLTGILNDKESDWSIINGGDLIGQCECCGGWFKKQYLSELAGWDVCNMCSLIYHGRSEIPWRK